MKCFIGVESVSKCSLLHGAQVTLQTVHKHPIAAVLL